MASSVAKNGEDVFVHFQVATKNACCPKGFRAFLSICGVPLQKYICDHVIFAPEWPTILILSMGVPNRTAWRLGHLGRKALLLSTR